MKIEKPKFPIQGAYWINQGYDENQVGYPSGRHGGLDVMPFLAGNVVYPASVYPVFSGRTMSVSNTDKDRGKGIRVRTECWPDLINYLKEKGVVPEFHTGKVYLDTLYWHLLEVTDLDNEIEQETPVGTAGNTGNVWSSKFPEANGQLLPVPEKYKGVPPYYGLHLHFETTVKDEDDKNLYSKDVFGRFDPMIIINYLPLMIIPKRVMKKDGITFGVLLDTPNGAQIIYATGEDQWRSWSKSDSYQLPTVNDNGNTNWEYDIQLPF